MPLQAQCITIDPMYAADLKPEWRVLLEGGWITTEEAKAAGEFFQMVQEILYQPWWKEHSGRPTH